MDLRDCGWPILPRATPRPLHLTGTGTPHLAYDDGTSFSNLMYGTRNPDGTWTKEIADRGIGGHLGNAGKNPQLKITDAGVILPTVTGLSTSPSGSPGNRPGNDWTSVTVDRGWGETGRQCHNGAYRSLPHLHHGDRTGLQPHLLRCPEPDAHEGPRPSCQ